LLHRLGRGGRHVDAVPGADFHIAQTRFGHGRHLGQLRVALGRSDRQSAQLAGLDLAYDRGHGVEAHLHLAADQIDQGRGAALVGHVGDLNACGILEHLGSDMLGAARAAAGEIDLTGILPGHGHQLRHRVGGNGVAHHQHIGHRADKGHGNQIPVVVVAELEQMRCDGMGRDHAHDHGVAVRGLGRHVHGQRVGDAGPVLHDHRLLEQRPQPVGHGAGHGIGAASGRGPHQHAHGLDGPVRRVLCLGLPGQHGGAAHSGYGK
jgi:hypothetical protein